MPTIGYVFDAYGTLFDVHSSMRKFANVIGPDFLAVSDTWRNKQLEYTWVRTLMGSYTDFWNLTESALDFALAKHGVAIDAGIRDQICESYWTLDAYDDVRDCLNKLRDNGKRLAILSNGTPDMIHAAVDGAGLGGLFDAIFSVDAVKAFKTAPEAYRMVTDAWECKAADLKFISSNRWDIAGATKFGMHCHWLNRAGAPDEYENYSPQTVISTLSELA